MSYETFAPPRLPSSVDVNTEIRSKENPFGDGYEQNVIDGLNARRDSLNIRWDGLTPEQCTALTSFLRTQEARPFLWQPPGSDVGQLWRCTTWSRSLHGVSVDLSATFQEVFA